MRCRDSRRRGAAPTFRVACGTVSGARIATLGERVEDVFEISSREGEPITDEEAVYLLENTLRQRLDRQVAAS